ncbi:MAG: hypothetical protein WCS72_16765 [Deltaproteobacteria bacterium]
MSMGGTIASQASDRLNITNYGGPGVPRVDPEKWVADLPDLALVARKLAHQARRLALGERPSRVRRIAWGLDERVRGR